MNLIAFTICSVCVRPDPWSGRSEATMNCGFSLPFTIPPGQDDAGSAVAPPPDVVEVSPVVVPPPPPPQPAATSARTPTTPRSATIESRFLNFFLLFARGLDRTSVERSARCSGQYQGNGGQFQATIMGNPPWLYRVSGMRWPAATFAAAGFLVLFGAGCGGIDTGKLESAIKSQTNDQLTRRAAPSGSRPSPARRAAMPTTTTAI